MDVVPEDSIEALATTLCEPNLKACITRQRVEERLDFALPVVRSEDWLLELFAIQVGKGDIKGAEVSTSISNEHETKSRQDQPALSFELAHALNVNVELDASTPENEVFARHPEGITTRRNRWIQCHYNYS